MAVIVAGRFETSEQADQVVRELIGHGFHRDDADVFFVNPPGQHDQLPSGGDQYADANANAASSGTMAGAGVGGAVGLAAAAIAVPVVGGVVALGVVALGAYTGSLVGTLAKLGEHSTTKHADASPGRPAGMMVAVHVISPRAEQIATEVLQQQGAEDVERKEGEWRDGQWKDFDPVAPPENIAQAPMH